MILTQKIKMKLITVYKFKNKSEGNFTKINTIKKKNYQDMEKVFYHFCQQVFPLLFCFSIKNLYTNKEMNFEHSWKMII